jgi:hypothetical protein
MRSFARRYSATGSTRTSDSVKEPVLPDRWKPVLVACKYRDRQTDALWVQESDEGLSVMAC